MRLRFLVINATVLALALPIVGCNSGAPEVETVTGASKLAFRQTRHDFGTVTAGDTVTHRFTFINAGDQPLELGKPKGS